MPFGIACAFLMPGSTIHMLNRTGAAPIAAGDLAPAMAKTDMAMPTQSGATKSLIPGFAQALESSIETAGHAGVLHTPKLTTATKVRNGSPSEPAPTNINLVPTQSQQPAAPAQPEIAYTLRPAAITVSVPVGTNDSVTLGDPTVVTDPTSLETVTSSTEGISESQSSDLGGVQQFASSLSPRDNATSNTFSYLPLISANNISSSLGGAPTPVGLTRAAQSPFTSTTSEPGVSSEGADSNGLAAAPMISNKAEPSVPSASAQQAMPIQQDWIGQIAPLSIAGTAASGTSGAKAKASVTTLSAPDAQFSSLETPQTATSGSFLAPATALDQPRISATSDTAGSSLQNLQTTALKCSANSGAIQALQQSPSVDQTLGSPANDNSTSQDLQTDATLVGPAFSFSDPANVDSTVSAQTTADVAAAETALTLTIPGIGKASSTSSGILDARTRKGSEVDVSGLSSPVSRDSESNNTQTMPLGPGWMVSAPQAPEATIGTASVNSGARQQNFSAGDSFGRTKTEMPTGTSSSAPRPVAAPNSTASATPKIQDAATPISLNSPLLSDVIWTMPTPPGNTTALTSLKFDDVNVGTEETAASNLADKTPLDSSAAFDQSANSGTDDNQRPTISQTSTATASSALFAPASVASNLSVSTQTVSVASALKLDSSSPAASSNSMNRGDAAGDSQLPSAVVVHRAAEAAEMSAGLQAWNGGDNAQTRMVQSARLTGNLGASEMNVSLRADTLGAVELRTHVTGDLVGASISVERHDAHAMLSNDLGTLHQALNDRQLRVGDVKVFQGAFGSDATAADSQSSPRREMGPQQQQSTNWTSGPALSSAALAATADRSDSKTLFDSNGRLSVRA